MRRIPDHWRHVPLADLAERIDYGVTASSMTAAIGPKFLRITDIQDDQVDWPSVPYCSISASDEASYLLASGDIVFARTGATTGKTFLVLFCPDRAVFASYLIRLRTKRGIIDPGYLAWFFRTQDYWAQITSTASGTAQPGINASKLRTLVIPVAPISEQRRIADILDKADAIRRKRKGAIALTEDLRRSAFLRSVGPEAEEYLHWAESAIEDLAARTPNSIRTGPFGSDLRHSEFVDSGIAVLGIDNAVQNRFAWAERRYVTQEKYEKLKRYTVYPGDVIVTIMGTTGRCAVVPDDVPVAITTKHLATITLDRSRAHPEFVSQSFHSHPEVLAQVEKASRGAIMSGLNLGLIKSLRIRVPPMEQQRRFVAQVEDIRNLQARMQTALQESEALFSSLLDRAFRGELTALTSKSASRTPKQLSLLE